MTADPLLTVFLPAALGIIMLGLGLSLTLADFARVVKFPKPVLIGLGCQLLLLPLVCFFIAKGFGLAPALAVGLMLLAACGMLLSGISGLAGSFALLAAGTLMAGVFSVAYSLRFIHDVFFNGEPIDLPSCMTYKGLMLSGVPNMATRPV